MQYLVTETKVIVALMLYQCIWAGITADQMANITDIIRAYNTR